MAVFAVPLGGLDLPDCWSLAPVVDAVASTEHLRAGLQWSARDYMQGNSNAGHALQCYLLHLLQRHHRESLALMLTCQNNLQLECEEELSASQNQGQAELWGLVIVLF